MLRSIQWHVLLAIDCRIAVLVSIDAEYREVASVAWPHPVVGLAAELSN